MTPDEIINKLAELNISITRRTLLNYESWKLVPEPIREGKGRGRGRYTDYPDNAWIYAYVAYRLMHDKLNLKPEMICILKSNFENKSPFKNEEDTLLLNFYSLYWSKAMRELHIT